MSPHIRVNSISLEDDKVEERLQKGLTTTNLNVSVALFSGRDVAGRKP
jgi:hypothetical protein